MNEKSLNFTLQFLFYNHIFKYRIIGVNIKSTSVVKIVILSRISLQLKKKKFFDFYPTLFYYLLKNNLIP